jgi:hypothetical protein
MILLLLLLLLLLISSSCSEATLYGSDLDRLLDLLDHGKANDGEVETMRCKCDNEGQAARNHGRWSTPAELLSYWEGYVWKEVVAGSGGRLSYQAKSRRTGHHDAVVWTN